MELSAIEKRGVKFLLHGTLLVIVVLFPLALGLYIWNDQPSATLHIDDPLAKKNQMYASGEEQFRLGDFAGASETYAEALSKAQTPNEESHIKFRRASSLLGTTEYLAAAKLFKEIADTETYLPITRAYAVEEMRRVFEKSDRDPKITELIFSTEPYKSLYTANNRVSTTYRKLSEYATTLYPIARAEFSIAEWYAQAIRVIKTGPRTEAEKARLVSEYKKMLEQRIAAAQKDIEERIQNSYWETELPTLYYRQGNIASELFLAGEKDILGDPEPFFQKAVEFAERPSYVNQYQPYYAKEQSSFARYHYASFLAKAYGAARSTHITELLRPFSSDDSWQSLSITQMFRTNYTSSGEPRETLITLAELSLPFKAFLNSLGLPL